MNCLQHILSRIIGFLTHLRGGLITRLAIRCFVKQYQVNLADAIHTEIVAYSTFNDFFTRSLKPDVRPIPAESSAIVSPADGFICAFGSIEQEQIFQAKNHNYLLLQLLANQQELVHHFLNGSFMTIYLSPKDYHRVHMPLAGQLSEMMYVPGRLFSVNQRAVENIPQLFARNERMIALFNTTFGPMAIIMIGAMLVGSITTQWHGVVTPPYGTTIKKWDYTQQNIYFEKGAEMGNFNMGSTVIVLLPAKQGAWDPHLTISQPIKMGEKIGSLL